MIKWLLTTYQKNPRLYPLTRRCACASNYILNSKKYQTFEFYFILFVQVNFVCYFKYRMCVNLIVL
jgi:hypothetical protein